MALLLCRVLKRPRTERWITIWKRHHKTFKCNSSALFPGHRKRMSDGMIKRMIKETLHETPSHRSYIQCPGTYIHTCYMEERGPYLFVCHRERDRELDCERDGPLKAQPWGWELSEELESDMHNQFPLFKSPLQAYLLEQASLNYFLYHLASCAWD